MKGYDGKVKKFMKHVGLINIFRINMNKLVAGELFYTNLSDERSDLTKRCIF